MMHGKITKFINNKDFGFILDKDGHSRFFHISDVSNPLEIAEHSLVEFEPAETAKGQCAKAITVKQNNNINKFIVIKGTRIKLTNIKQYGVSHRIENKEYDKASDEYMPYGKHEIAKMEHYSAEREYQVAQFNLDHPRDKDLTVVKLEYSRAKERYEKAKKTYIENNLTKSNDTDEFPNRDNYKIHDIEVSYLYVKTFQNDNFTWDEDEVNIKATLSELDENLCN